MNLEFFENESISLRIFTDVDIPCKELPKRYHGDYVVAIIKDVELFKSIYQKYQAIVKDKIVILGQDTKKLIDEK